MKYFYAILLKLYWDVKCADVDTYLCFASNLTFFEEKAGISILSCVCFFHIYTYIILHPQTQATT